MHSENVKIYTIIAYFHLYVVFWKKKKKNVSVNLTVFIYSFMAKNEPEVQNRNSPKNLPIPSHISQLLKCSSNKFRNWIRIIFLGVLLFEFIEWYVSLYIQQCANGSQNTTCRIQFSHPTVLVPWNWTQAMRFGGK